jgi:hypothetical protein
MEDAVDSVSKAARVGEKWSVRRDMDHVPGAMKVAAERDADPKSSENDD